MKLEIKSGQKNCSQPAVVKRSNEKKTQNTEILCRIAKLLF